MQEENYRDPLDVLMEMMNNTSLAEELRLEAAITLMPYFHEPLAPIEPEQEEEE